MVTYFNPDPSVPGTKYYEIEIDDPELTKHGFSRFKLPLNGNATKMILYNTKDRALITYVDFDRTSLENGLKLLEEKLLDEQLVESKAGRDTVRSLVAYFRNACISRIEDKDPDFEFFKNGCVNGRSKKQKCNKSEDSKKEITVQRYTMVDGSIAEAVIVGTKPKFAIPIPKVGFPDQISSILLYDSIDVDEYTIIKPPSLMAYINRPYIFKSEEQFEEFAENIKTKDLDALYKKVKSIWRKYVDADDFHISICAADTIFTYFQDKIGLTHYLYFVGGNTSGKSNNLTVLHFLAYRNMTDSGMTAANVYTYLGSGEEGLGTICEDEADNVDEDFDKMKVYKNGYTTGRPYHRTDTSVGRQQLKFNTFCFKAFAAEKLPDSVTARGFNQRIIEIPCVYGFPAYDISELVNPAGEEEFEDLLDELNTMRNALLVYRLLHFREKIPNIKLNIQNREKQLFKPILRVFQGAKTLSELLPVISKYVNQRRESNANTLHAFLYELVTDLIKAQDTYELGSDLIWNTIKETLQGKEILSKPQSYDTVEFGIISQKGVIETLIQVFGAKAVKRHSGRTLIFDYSKLQRLSRIYKLSIDVRVMTPSSSDGEGVADVAHVADVGLDKHMNGQAIDNKIDGFEQLHDETIENVENITSQQDDTNANSSVQAPQAPHAPPVDDKEYSSTAATTEEHQIPDSIYRAYGDTWKCHNCNTKGDKWFMIKHNCKGQLKSKSERR
jgi:hypothetical protein